LFKKTEIKNPAENLPDFLFCIKKKLTQRAGFVNSAKRD